jgi:DNA-binding NtrC family response regulator
MIAPCIRPGVCAASAAGRRGTNKKASLFTGDQTRRSRPLFPSNSHTEVFLSSGSILVVEDEEQVRTMIVRLLGKQGYHVLQAENGRVGLEIARDHINELALVVTDMVMPEMGGAALLQELRTLRSALPVLCMTGYTQAEVAGEGQLQDAAFIEKPFMPAAFIQTVDGLVNEARKAG